MMGSSKERYTGIFIDVIELWTALLALAVSFVAVCWPISLLAAAPISWANALALLLIAVLLGGVAALHWLLLERVTERRRWAYLVSVFLGLIYLFPPSAWSAVGLWQVCGAVIPPMLVACVVAAWGELTDGW